MRLIHHREREIFGAACELATPAERAGYLEAACGGDTGIRQRVEEMLQLKDAADAFFPPDEAAGSVADALTAPKTHRLRAEEAQELSGAILGRYRLLERIGEGGFGRVYRAEQLEPVRRQVALKIIKVGMDTHEVMGRFEAERQALARMDHPNVAKILDAGTTSGAADPGSPIPAGRPYFVMELVQGVPITEYCDQNRLDLRQRLELFLPVCHALQHAHQKGIIHRDLKPSNILVTVQEGRPAPKVIDFGIAKAIQQPLTDLVVTTGWGRLLGTPAYMSPEQASAGRRDIDTRSDVYSLGVVLYELLCGQPPFDPGRLEQAGLAGVQHILLEEDPPPPSARFRALGDGATRVAELRGNPPSRWIAQLRGELDWIVLKALEKDRDRRYVTANALARDLERKLREEPVAAAPPGLAYRTHKFIRRHRHAVAATAGIVLAVLAGWLLTMWAFFQAREQRNLARSSEQRANAEALRARQIAYASDLNLAQHALERSNLGRARQLLDRNRPEPGQDDLRGWEWFYLSEACRSEALCTLGQQPHAIGSLAASSDGRRVASAAFNGTVAIWDLPGRRLLRTLANAGTSVAISPDARQLAVAALEGGVALRPLEAPETLTPLHDPDSMTSLAFSSDGQKLAAFTVTGALCVWDLPTGQSFARHSGFPTAGRHTGDLAWSADGQWIFLGGSDGEVRRVDPRTGQVPQTWRAHAEAITALAVSPDDQQVATAAGFSEQIVRRWRTRDGTLEDSLEGPQAWVSALAFSRDGIRLAAAGADQTLRIWDLATRSPAITLRGHTHEVWSLLFLADGQTLVSGGKDGTLNVWNLHSPSSTTDSIESALRAAAFSLAGNTLLALDAAGQVVRWTTGSTPPFEALPACGAQNTLLAVAPRNQWIATADSAGRIQIWREPDSTPVGRSPAKPAAGEPSSLQFTADERLLISIRDASSVQVLSTDTWQPAAEWTSPRNPLRTVALSPNGRHLAAGGDTVAIFDLLTGRLLVEFAAHQQATDAVSFSPDGQWLATGSQEGLAILWEVRTWKPAATFRGHLLGVHAVAFSPDGRRLVTGSVDREAVKWWDLASHQEILNLAWPGHLVAALQFSPDGRILAGLSSTSGMRLWRASDAPPAVAAPGGMPIPGRSVRR